MAPIKLHATLAVIATLYCTAVAFPLFPPFPPAPPAEPTTATTESTPVTERSPVTERTPATESSPATEHTPATERTPATEHTPATESSPATEHTPAITTSATLPTAEPTSAPADPSAPAGGMPGSLGGFLQVHNQGNQEQPTADSTPDSTLSPTQDTRPNSLKNFLKVHSPENSVPLAFHVQLSTNVTLRRYAEVELQNFTQLKPGQFAMAKPSFDPFHGTFIAAVKGVYHFTAQVHLYKNHPKKASVNPYITASICIEGDCEKNAALQSIAGITSERFSALVTGELQVQKDQVVSVFVKNSSDRRVVVDESTSFMGYFVSDSY